MEKDLEKAYFGIINHDFNSDKFVERNLFGSIRVLTSIAMYKTRKDIQKRYTSVEDVVHFCFGDVQWRAEWEYCVLPFTSRKDVKPEKVDIYTMYVHPNMKLLYDMVQNFSVASCRRVLKKYKRR